MSKENKTPANGHLSASATQSSSATGNLHTEMSLSASATESTQVTGELLTDIRAQVGDVYLKTMIERDPSRDELLRQNAALYKRAVFDSAWVDAFENSVKDRPAFVADRLATAKRVIEEEGYDGTLRVLFDLPESKRADSFETDRKAFSAEQADRAKKTHSKRLAAFEKIVFDEWQRQVQAALFKHATVLYNAMLKRWDSDEKPPSLETVRDWVNRWKRGEGLQHYKTDEK